MNKAQLTEAVAAATDVSKAEAGRAVECMLIEIEGALQKGNRVSLVGFGTFKTSVRKASQGRTIQISASKSVGFKAGKALKESL